GLDCVRLRDGPAGGSHPFPNWRRWGGPDRRGSVPRRPSGDRSSSGHPPPTTGGRGGARLKLFAVFDVQLVQHDLAVIALVARVGLLAVRLGVGAGLEVGLRRVGFHRRLQLDRKSTRLNSSHVKISYAVFCLKKKKLTDCDRSSSPRR